MSLLDTTKDFIQKNKDRQPVGSTDIPSTGNHWDLYHWILHNSRLPWLLLKGISIPYQEMLKEAKSVHDRFVDHREDNGTGWRSLCIHGISSTHTNSDAYYGYNNVQAPYVWTDIEENCPVTFDFFRQNFHYVKYQRIRFMLLEPGGYIEPHRDSNSFTLGAINISLNNPSGCRLVTEQGTVPHGDGTAVMFNTSYEHSAWNDSDENRYHIIVHGMPDSNYWKNIVVDSFLNQ